jgi:hypothetical protein
MPTAEEVAFFLSYEFLKRGNYSAASGPVEVPALARAVAASDSENQLPDAPPVGFEGLHVQSVGMEEGVDDPKVHIYLTRGSAKLIKSLPEEISGVPVVAHKMGAINVKPDSTMGSTNRGNFYQKNGRVCCGSSCAPTSENCSGTLGALVRVHGEQGLFLLSNNHVLAGCNHVPRNQPVLSPSSNDGKADLPSPREIGRHFKIHELRSGDPIFVNPCDADVAIAKAVNLDGLSSWQGDDASGYDTPAQTSAPVSGMRVKKIGRTTGLKFGQVEARIPTPMPVSYQSRHFKGMVWFKDVWTINADSGNNFALPGDSGSLVVTEDGGRAVGLLFAANPTGDYAWMIPMPCVTASFGGIQLVHGHGV